MRIIECAAVIALAVFSTPPLGSAQQTTASAGGSEIITVRLSNFAFGPDHLRLKAGMPIRLRLMNESNGGHDFSAPAFFAARSGLLGGSLPNRRFEASRTVSGTALWQKYCNKISRVDDRQRSCAAPVLPRQSPRKFRTLKVD
jgi:hypothetical protein